MQEKPVIPVFEPLITEADIQEVLETLRRGEISGSFGSAVLEFERQFAEYLGVPFAVAVSSGTASLHLAAAAAGIGRGDEVLVSSSTNIATALAVVHNNALPVPVDSEDLTWNLDLTLLERLIGPNTRAIIPVHLFGVPVDMDALMAIANRHNLVVIEDCAEALGARVRGRLVGTFGTLGCFSFYANKVITTGEGGMVVTDDAEMAERLRLLRNLGFTTPRYRHEVLGFNFRMTGLQAALGVSQLRRVKSILAAKQRLAQEYNEFLANIPWIKLPHEPEWATCAHWMYAIELLPNAPISRDQLMQHMLDAGIGTRTFFCPMNQQPALLGLPNFRPAPCPVADRIWEHGMYLPSSFSLTRGEVERIVDVIRKA